MKIILNPSDNAILDKEYEKALSSAVELSILTAFLTDWKPRTKLSINCKEVNFIVGTDFGITKKDACFSVLRWLPSNFKNDFLAADGIGGFHPKLILWKDAKSECYAVVGSSNLTQAAFSTNVEANVSSKIAEADYNRIKEWIYQIRINCAPISEDWLDTYTEMTKRTSRTKGKKSIATQNASKTVKVFALPTGKSIDEAILRRRKQERAFSSIKDQLTALLAKCADGKISNMDFYDKMVTTWNESGSRLQGSGFQISGKHGNWRGVCKSLLIIINEAKTSSLAKLDNIVKQEIDSLASAENPLRGSWLSEMLCHYFPDNYPLVNKPVRLWLQDNRYRSPKKSSQGSAYIDLSMKLRTAIKNNDSNKAKNLSELDHAIWQWARNKGLQ